MAGKRPSSPEDFIAGNTDGIEAVVIRIGAGEAQMVLIDSEGRWDRWVYHSIEECREVAARLGIEDVHIGEYPEKTRVRMNAYRRPPEDFDVGAYPEQGAVGPVIPYPENRPRSNLSQSDRESAPEPQGETAP